MTRILYMCLDAALAAVVLFPLLLILNKTHFRNPAKVVCYLIFSMYLSGMYAVVGLPAINYIRFDPHYNLIPFAYMFSDYGNSLLNVLLFVPLGFFLPVCWKHYQPFHRTLLFGLGGSFLIETLQIFTYRATDINDLITNSLGTVIGWCISRLFLRCLPSASPNWKTKELWIVCGLSFGVMFLIHPFLSNLFY